LLRRLASSEPYYKKQRRLEAEGASEGGQKLLEGASGEEGGHKPGPIRTADSKHKSQYGSAYGPPSRGGAGAGSSSRGGRGGGRGGRGFPSAASVPIQPKDILPPADQNITSLFVTGVEDDLPENDLRVHFAQYGALRSVVCSHRSHCAFMNYMDRAGAEAAAAACQGRAVVKGVPLRVQWGKPRTLDNMDRTDRIANAQAGRGSQQTSKRPSGQKAIAGSSAAPEDLDSLGAVAPPPGQGDVDYAAMAGE
jgi:pre-mRNA-splicing factor RBM22/SLT11